MVAIPFVPPLDDVHYGAAEHVSPLIRRVIAENRASTATAAPAPTTSSVHGDVVVIDPGPALDAHRDALGRRAAAGDRVRAILVTHCHSDHSPLAAWLPEETGAPTVAFGPHGRPSTSTTRNPT